MTALLLGLLLACPAGTIDRLEGGQMAVLGSNGVRVIATRAVSNRREHELREGDRIELGPGGRCEDLGPDLSVLRRVQARLRAFQH
jgi:hypothetical protein